MKSIILKLSILLLVFSSCSRDITISKRHYRPGYYVSIQSKQNKEVENKKVGHLKDSLRITVSKTIDTPATYKDNSSKASISKVLVLGNVEQSLYQECKEDKIYYTSFEEASAERRRVLEEASFKLSNEKKINILQRNTPKKKNFGWKEVLFWLGFAGGFALLIYGIVSVSAALIIAGSILSLIAYFFIDRLSQEAYKLTDYYAKYIYDNPDNLSAKKNYEYYMGKSIFYKNLKETINHIVGRIVTAAAIVIAIGLPLSLLLIGISNQISILTILGISLFAIEIAAIIFIIIVMAHFNI